MQRVALINIVGLSPNLLGAHTPRLREFARSTGGVRTLRPPLPAVTCTAQSTMLTGLAPDHHGIVGNGWHDRALGEVQFWKQSNALVAGEKIWETAKRRDANFTCANVCWWYAMHASTDIFITPRPVYKADGRKLEDCLTHPPTLRDALQQKHGPFPLFNFWGPRANIVSSDWIAAAALHTMREFKPTLTLIYLPHLDYCLQRVGPAHASIHAELREVDRVFGALLEHCERENIRPLVVSEYGIVPVTDAVWINRALREVGLLKVRLEDGREVLDLQESEAFAVVDHQLAHVSLKNPARASEVAQLLERVAGVARVLHGESRRAAHLDHARSGDVVCLSAPDRWFSYGWWMDDAKAPDFARTVDIFKKPGYDPCELLLDPARPLLAARIAMKLMLRKLGVRVLLDPTPLDASLIRGSHGLAEVPRGFDPVLLGELPDPFSEAELPMSAVRDATLAALGLLHTSAGA
ncbi:MAG: alkaline phosphatase family protein [Phycisphaerales bacterium]|nr:alkaline phosphatase family protein [Phycisphaerales bacterium]